MTNLCNDLQSRLNYIHAIRMYGAINGYTTETYESLHKDFVKIPYSSNKKNGETQLLQIVSI